ncbi:unnamed protein product [Paramecium octaurelia]|uniref:Nephrocystin-4 n=1 Tax=Paramecium octaurelia TaxID=43137 RepID=A0A8S1U2R3_PAROT|nr:unnamed protein product [Paramecium octaurelia]
MSTEDINSIKKFLKFQKMHKSLPSSIPIQMGLDSKAYKLIVSRIGGFRRPQNPVLNLQFSVAANFFIQNSQGEKCFFGRTYNSPRLNVEFGPDGVNYEHPIIPIYYHTRIINNKDMPLLVILEIQAFESQQDLVLKRMHLGWCELAALTITTQPTKLNFRKGSPRILLLGQQVNFESSGISVTCEIVQSEEFQISMHLAPENALCGLGDELPGLKKSFVAGDFELSRSMVVFMSKLQVLIPDTMEADIYRQVQKYRTYKYRTPDDYKGDIQIINKRLIVAFHNGWTFINTRGTNNFVPLGETRMLVNEFVDQKQIQYKQLAYHGVIDINNVCSTDPTVNSGMLVAQLEYEAMFLVSNLTKETMQLTLGWIPIYINNKFGADEMVEEDFIVGPGKTLDGRPLVTFQNPDQSIKLKGSLNLSGGGFQIQDLYMGAAQQQQQHPQQQQGYQQIPQQSNLNQHQPVQQQYQNKQEQVRGSDVDIRTQVKLKDFEQQLLRLQEENERLRRLAIQQTSDPQKQQEYLQAIEKLREENRLLQFTQARQFEGLEKLIKDQKVVDRTAAPPVVLAEARPQNTVIKPIDSYAYPVPSATLKPITRTDVTALVDDPTSIDQENRLMALEMQDERKDQIIVIQPVSMKQILGPYPICKSVQIGIIFYDLQTFKSPFLNLEYYNDERNFKYNLENGNPLRLLYNNEIFSCKFNIEASLQRYANLDQDFARYLFNKNLILDIWDSESLFLFGSVRIPLRGIMRGGKQNAQIMADVEIFDPQSKKVKGTLQIVIKNIGKIGQQDMSKTVPLENTYNGFQKKKLVSEKPVNRLDVPAQAFDGNSIQDRIKKIKQQNLQEMIKNKQSQQRSLNEVLKYKEIKKPTLVRTIMQGFLQNEKVVHSFYGKCEIVPLQFKNTHPKPEQFTVNIEDPESRMLEYQEFFLIGNPAEWKYWVTNNKYPEPENYDLIRMKENQGKTQYYFILDPNQEVTLLFKFISFRQYDYRVDDHERTPEYIKKYMQSRHITILLQQDGKMMDGLRIIVEPHQQPIDHVLRFYERENRQTRLIIPRLFNQPLQQQPHVHITDPDVMIEWSSDFNSIRLNLRIGEPQSVKIFNILLYQDQYQHKIIANWKIEVYSLSTIDIEVPLGQRVCTKITFPCDITRIIKMTSSNKMITFVKPFDSEITMLPGKINLVPINILALQDGKHLIKLNGVDIHSQELIYSWLVNVHAEPQPPSATYDLRCIDGRESRHQVNYKNQVNYTTQYNIVSSSEFVKIIDTSISTGPNEIVQFKIRVLPGSEELVRVFITDIDERIFDVIVLNIKYVY